MKNLYPREKRVPFWSLLSVLLTPLAPLVGAIAVVVCQTVLPKPAGALVPSFPQVSRVGVLVMLACIVAGLFVGVIALIKREGLVAASGIVTNVALIGLFWYFEFYKLGFDQDRGAMP